MHEGGRCGRERRGMGKGGTREGEDGREGVRKGMARGRNDGGG